jgi:hypothetical protein
MFSASAAVVEVLQSVGTGFHISRGFPVSVLVFPCFLSPTYVTLLVRAQAF